MKLNSSKTIRQDNVVHSSIKPDKLCWIFHKNQYCNDVQQELYFISMFAEKFPNAGQVSKLLEDLYDKIIEMKEE